MVMRNKYGYCSSIFYTTREIKHEYILNLEKVTFKNILGIIYFDLKKQLLLLIVLLWTILPGQEETISRFSF